MVRPAMAATNRQRRERAAARIAANIRRIRLDANLTLMEVAAKSGLGQGHLSEVERGLRWRKWMEQVLALADALGCQAWEIFDIEEE